MRKPDFTSAPRLSRIVFITLVVSSLAHAQQPAQHQQAGGQTKTEAAARRRQQEARHKRAMNLFWTEFQAAIAESDKQKVAGMVEYPFASGMLADDKDGVEVADEAAFIRKYAVLFPARLRRQIKSGKPYLVDTDTGEFYFEYFSPVGSLVFIFKKTDGTYKLTNTMAPG